MDDCATARITFGASANCATGCGTDEWRFFPMPRELLTKAEFHRHLVEIGMMSQLSDTDADFEDLDDQMNQFEGM